MHNMVVMNDDWNDNARLTRYRSKRGRRCEASTMQASFHALDMLSQRCGRLLLDQCLVLADVDGLLRDTAFRRCPTLIVYTKDIQEMALGVLYRSRVVGGACTLSSKPVLANGRRQTAASSSTKSMGERNGWNHSAH